MQIFEGTALALCTEAAAFFFIHVTHIRGIIEDERIERIRIHSFFIYQYSY